MNGTQPLPSVSGGNPLKERLVSPFRELPPTLKQRASTATKKYIKKMGMTKQEVQNLRKFGSDYSSSKIDTRKIPKRIHSEGVMDVDDLNPDISEWKREVSDAMLLVGEVRPLKTSPIRNIVTPDAYRVKSPFFSNISTDIRQKNRKHRTSLKTTTSKGQSRAWTTGTDVRYLKKKNNITKRIQKLARGKVHVSDSVVEKLIRLNKLDISPATGIGQSNTQPSSRSPGDYRASTSPKAFRQADIQKPALSISQEMKGAQGEHMMATLNKGIWKDRITSRLARPLTSEQFCRVPGVFDPKYVNMNAKKFETSKEKITVDNSTSTGAEEAPQVYITIQQEQEANYFPYSREAHEGAVAMQRCFRSHLDRVRRSTVAIQSVMRRFLTYRYYIWKRNKWNAAATLIQTRCRGLLARRLVKWMRFVPHLQRILRGHFGRNRARWHRILQMLRQNAAMSCMNTVYVEVAKIRTIQIDAAVRIQCNFRCRKAKSLVQRMRLHRDVNMATRIQSTWRMYLGRCLYWNKVYFNAAQLIQKVTRAFLYHHVFYKRKVSQELYEEKLRLNDEEAKVWVCRMKSRRDMKHWLFGTKLGKRYWKRRLKMERKYRNRNNRVLYVNNNYAYDDEELNDIIIDYKNVQIQKAAIIESWVRSDDCIHPEDFRNLLKDLRIADVFHRDYPDPSVVNYSTFHEVHKSNTNFPRLLHNEVDNFPIHNKRLVKRQKSYVNRVPIHKQKFYKWLVSVERKNENTCCGKGIPCCSPKRWCHTILRNCKKPGLALRRGTLYTIGFDRRRRVQREILLEAETQSHRLATTEYRLLHPPKFECKSCQKSFVLYREYRAHLKENNIVEAQTCINKFSYSRCQMKSLIIQVQRDINTNDRKVKKKWRKKSRRRNKLTKRTKRKKLKILDPLTGNPIKNPTCYQQANAFIKQRRIIVFPDPKPPSNVFLSRLKGLKRNINDEVEQSDSVRKAMFIKAFLDSPVEEDELRLYAALAQKVLNLKWKYYIEDCKEYYHAYVKHKKKKFKKEKKTKWRRRKSSLTLDHENLTTKLKSMRTIIKLRTTLWDMGLDTLVPENQFRTLLYKLNLDYFTNDSFAELKELLGYDQHNTTVHVKVIGKWYIDDVINRSSVIQYNKLSWSAKFLKVETSKSRNESSTTGNPELQLASSSNGQRIDNSINVDIESKAATLNISESILQEWLDANHFGKQNHDEIENGSTTDELIKQAHGSSYSTHFKKGKLQLTTIDYMTRRISNTSTDQKVSMAHLIKFPAGTSREILIKKYPSWASLSKLGFSFDTCIVALKLHDGNMKLASKWLLSLSEDDIDKLIEFEMRNIVQDKKYKSRQNKEPVQEEEEEPDPEGDETKGKEGVAESVEQEKDIAKTKNHENDSRSSKWICKRRRNKSNPEGIQTDATSNLLGGANELKEEKKSKDLQDTQITAELNEESKDDSVETCGEMGDAGDQNESQDPQENQNAQEKADKSQNEDGVDTDTFNVKNRTSYEALFYKPLWKIVERLVSYKVEHSNFE